MLSHSKLTDKQNLKIAMSPNLPTPVGSKNGKTMKLSIVILCWNDLKVISDCLASIYATTHKTDFEVIVSDNGSTDGSLEHIREAFPAVRILENGTNLRFAKGNNVGIEISRGEYILILNPDTPHTRRSAGYNRQLR